MEEWIPVVKLLDDSVDICEAEPYSRLQHMLFCFFGVDAMNPKNMLIRRIKMVKALHLALIDIFANGCGLASFQYPSKIRVSKDALQAETIKMIFALDFEYFKVDVRYCDGIKSCHVKGNHIHNWSEICDVMCNAFCFVLCNKTTFQ